MVFPSKAVTCTHCDQWIVPNHAHTVWYHVWPEGADGQWLAPESSKGGFHYATPRDPSLPA